MCPRRPPPERASRPSRAPGRPVRDSADQRAGLIDAAIACFVRRGIGATTLRAIADEARVSPALLHYYFGDKRQLVDAVVAERVLPVVAQMRGAVEAADGDVAGLVVAYVEKMGELVQAHPWLPALWVREVLCEGGLLRELVISRAGPQLPQLLAQRFAVAQREGQINPALDPRLLVVSLVGLTLFPAAGAPIWRQLFATDDIDAATLRDHTLALLAHGLGPG